MAHGHGFLGMDVGAPFIWPEVGVYPCGVVLLRTHGESPLDARLGA